MECCVCEVRAYLSELSTVVESVFVREEVGCCDEILDSCDDGCTITRGDEVVLDAHQLKGLCSRLLGLWNVYKWVRVSA